MTTEVYDCIIIGGGPAGLNAAVVLGRSRRKVLLFDTGQYRNRQSHGMHNYLTRDHIRPVDFISICHEELEKYNIQRLVRKIVSGKRNDASLFEVKDDQQRKYFAKKLLVATGLHDNVPTLPGFADCYGKSVFHCPYCDGWEVRDKRIAVYAKNKEGWELALNLKGWSSHVTLYTDGKNKVKPEQRKHLQANDVDVVLLPIRELVHNNGQLQKIMLNNGESHDCDAMFFVNGFTQQCDIAEAFGCEVTRKGVIMTNRYQQTNIPGLYVAGDASKDMHFVVVAAAEGAKAGVIINKELLKDEWQAASEQSRRKTI